MSTLTAEEIALLQELANDLTIDVTTEEVIPLGEGSYLRKNELAFKDSDGYTGAVYSLNGIKYNNYDVFTFDQNGKLTIHNDVYQNTTFIKSEHTFINDRIFNIGSGETGPFSDRSEPFGISVGGVTGNTGPPAAEFLYYPNENKWEISATGGGRAKLSGIETSSGLYDAVNNSQLMQEAMTRLDKDASLTTSLSSEASTRLSTDESLASELWDETQVRHASDLSLTDSLTSEASSRVSSDGSLATLLNTSLSTERSNRISGDDSLNTELTSEASSRYSADLSLSNRISTETLNRISGGTSLTTLLSTTLSTEISYRESGNALYFQQLGTEQSTRYSADVSLTTLLSTETLNRIAGDDSLTTSLSTETSNRVAKDASLALNIFNEVFDRASGDASLTTSLSTEISNRISGDSSLTTLLDTSLSTEISNRISGDASLTDRLDFETSELVTQTNIPSTYVAFGASSTGLTGSGKLRWTGDSKLDIVGDVIVTEKISVGETVFANSFSSTSDKNLKTNIEDLDNSELIYSLRSVKYNWIDLNQDQRIKYGFIAQEVEETLPNIVNYNDYNASLDYIQLIAPILKEVQKLRADVDELQKK